MAMDGLDRYREAASAWFLAKADADLPDARLEDLQRSKRELAATAREALTDRLTRVLEAVPASVDLLPDRGTFHAVFRVATTSGELYARTSLPALSWPALDFRIGEWASRLLPARGVPVPRVLHVDVTRERLPFDLEVVEAAPGEPLARGPGAEGGTRSLGALLARLHSVRCEGAGPLDPASVEGAAVQSSPVESAPVEGAPVEGRTPAGLHRTWSDYVLLRLAEHLELCRRHGVLTDGEVAMIEETFARCAPRLESAPSVLLHGDLGNPNVLVEGEGITALLDWEDALVGDPIFDLAGWGTFVGNHERRAALLEGYLAADSPALPAELPEDFELRYWLYYLRIMLAKTVHRHRFGYSRTDSIPARERLRPALAGLDRSLTELG